MEMAVERKEVILIFFFIISCKRKSKQIKVVGEELKKRRISSFLVPKESKTVIDPLERHLSRN